MRKILKRALLALYLIGVGAAGGDDLIDGPQEDAPYIIGLSLLWPISAPICWMYEKVR